MVETGFDNEVIHKRISLSISLVLHLLLFILILLWPSLKYDFPPPGKEGVLVIFGDTQESQDKEEVKETVSEEKIEKQNKEIKEKEKFEKQIVEEKDEDLLKIEKEDKKVKETIIPKDINTAKDEFSKLFNSRGTKKNNNGVQGDPLGSNDAEVLEGITRGKGKIGEGLDSRGILYEPNFEDSSQKSGKVVVKVCINETGNVISSKYTQRGSSTLDSELIEIAVRNAKKYRFTPSNKKLQCGTITIEFIVK